MAFHDYKNVTKKEKVWTFDELKADHDRLSKEVKLLKKECSEYHSENKKLLEEMHYFKSEKKNFKYLQENLNEEIKILKKQITQLSKK